MISKEVKNFLPVLCPSKWVYFCHFWVTERLDLRHRVAFPRPTVTHRLLLGGWPAPVPHRVYIWHREDSSKAGHRSHRSLIALSGPDVRLIEMYSLVFVYHSRLLSSPRAERAGPKGLRTESAWAFTGRRNSHSGRGEDFLTGQPNIFTETAVTPERKVEKPFPMWEINKALNRIFFIIR